MFVTQEAFRWLSANLHTLVRHFLLASQREEMDTVLSPTPTPGETKKGLARFPKEW